MPTDWGTCRLCGQHRVLTYEHVPARSSFNVEPVTMFGLENWLRRDTDGTMSEGEFQDRGAGAHTLCGACNNTLTGSLYVPELKRWTHGAAGVLAQVFSNPAPQGNVIEWVMKRARPALFLKQVVAMFASINETGFMDSHAALRNFVLKPEAVGLPQRYHFYLAFAHPGSTIARHAGLSALMREGVWGATWITDIVWPPFGYMMTVDEPTPLLPVGDISSFAKYRHDERVDLRLLLPVLAFDQPYPGEFSDPMYASDADAPEPFPTLGSVRLPMTVRLASGEERLGGELTHPLPLAEWTAHELTETQGHLLRILGAKEGERYEMLVRWSGENVSFSIKTERGEASLEPQRISLKAVGAFIGHNDLPNRGECRHVDNLTFRKTNAGEKDSTQGPEEK